MLINHVGVDDEGDKFTGTNKHTDAQLYLLVQITTYCLITYYKSIISSESMVQNQGAHSPMHRYKKHSKKIYGRFELNILKLQSSCSFEISAILRFTRQMFLSTRKLLHDHAVKSIILSYCHINCHLKVVCRYE